MSTEDERDMIYRLVVPGPIEDVEEIRVLEWHRQVGAPVEAGVLLVELETHKAVVEVRLTRKAVLRRLVCREGEWQAIGKSLAYFSDTLEEELPEAPGDVDVLAVEFVIT